MAAQAVNVIDVTPQKTTPDNLPAVVQEPDTQHHAARIAKAVAEAEKKRLEAQKVRRDRQKRWGLFAAAVAVPVIGFLAFPEPVVTVLPGAMVVYDKLGIGVNIYGLEIDNVTHQYVLANNTRVLAIRGEIRNVSGGARAIPPLKFSLLDKTDKTLFSWNLKSLPKRALKAGESTSFLTRVAAPPKLANDFRIHFASK